MATSAWLVFGPSTLSGCSSAPSADSYEAVCADNWRLGALSGLSGVALGKELVRHPVLALSSHNTQSWKFALESGRKAITILPDPARRCPAVDPDELHVFVSLGCATENLIQAALVHGLHGNAQFDPAGGTIRVALEPTSARTTPLFSAVAQRQCKSGAYDGQPLSGDELAQLQRAGSSDTVRLLLLTDRPAMDKTPD